MNRNSKSTTTNLDQLSFAVAAAQFEDIPGSTFYEASIESLSVPDSVVDLAMIACGVVVVHTHVLVIMSNQRSAFECFGRSSMFLPFTLLILLFKSSFRSKVISMT